MYDDDVVGYNMYVGNNSSALSVPTTWLGSFFPVMAFYAVFFMIIFIHR